jgi:hypothetical protein
MSALAAGTDSDKLRKRPLPLLDNVWCMVYKLNCSIEGESEASRVQLCAAPRAGPSALPGRQVRPRIFFVVNEISVQVVVSGNIKGVGL